MTRCHYIAVALALLAIVASVITGCGGGGGGSSQPGANYVITGTVKDRYSDVPVVGAIVTIAGNSTTTDSNGVFRLTYDTKPVAATWSVDGSAATPLPGYYIDWAQMGIVTQVFDASALPMSNITSSITTMPTVYLMSKQFPPP